MATALGVYWAPGHMRPEDERYMRELQPKAIRILEADFNRVYRAHQAVPNAFLLPRIHSISEEGAKDRLQTNPVQLGVEHAEFWDAKLRTWEANKDWNIPRNQLAVVGINEPRVWPVVHVDRKANWQAWWDETRAQCDIVNAYNVSMMERCSQLGIRMTALNTSVGWPANLHDDEPSYWDVFTPIREALQTHAEHFLCMHEYWYSSGPQTQWGWHGGRFAHNTWSGIKIIIGECGIENRVDTPRMQAEGKPKGWKGSVSATAYAQQLVQYVRSCEQDSRIFSVQVYLTDYYNNEWASLDTMDAHNQIIDAVRNFKPVPLVLQTPDKLKPITPPPGTPPVVVPPVVVPPVTPSLAKVVWPIAEPIIVNQYFGENLSDYTQFGLKGHNGLDLRATSGTPIKAIADGEVFWVDFDAAYGYYVRLWHPQLQVCSFYAHMRVLSPLKYGDKVIQGQKIGEVGSTGNSTGPHLHLEIRVMENAHQYGQFNYGYGTRGQIDPFGFMQLKLREK